MSKGNDDPDYKFIKNGKIENNVTLKIFQIILIILENGMNILGVSLPKNVMYKKIITSIQLLLIISLFTFIIAVYFSKDLSIKINQNRASYSKIIKNKALEIPLLKNDTNNVIYFNLEDNVEKIKKRHFWNL